VINFTLFLSPSKTIKHQIKNLVESM